MLKNQTGNERIACRDTNFVSGMHVRFRVEVTVVRKDE